MRIKSLLASACIGLACLGLVGCASDGIDSEFIAVSDEANLPDNGTLVFNFARAQQAFVVGNTTTTFKFDFFGGAAGELLLSERRDFAPTIRIAGIPTAANTVRITTFDANGIPRQTIAQAVGVDPRGETVVEGLSNATDVAFSRLRIAPGTVGELGENNSLSQVDVQTGGVSQVFLFAEYSEGTVVLVGDQGNYSTTNGGVASVSPTGAVTGVSPGVSTLIAEFDMQSLSIPILVTDDLNQVFTSIDVAHTQPLTLPAGGDPFQVTVTATRGDGQQFGLNPASTALTYVVASESNAFVVSSTGVVTVAVGAPAGATGVLTIQYQNPDGTFATATANLVVQ